MKEEFINIIPKLAVGMDAPFTVFEHFNYCEKKPEFAPTETGWGLDLAIFAAFKQAERQGEGLEEVLNHVDYIHSQLGIFKSNLGKAVEEIELQKANEKFYTQ